MECLKFTLKGNTAFFKKNDMNSIFFTYSNIHKVAIRGLLGAIIGLEGYNYNSYKDNTKLPEFYTELEDIKIGIVPKTIFNKKFIEFTNTTGFANNHGTLIVKQQWLFDPEWDIYVLDNNKHYENIKDYILNGKCEYIPYLGSNDHQANILDPEIIECEYNEEDEDYIHSLFVGDLENNTPDYEDEDNAILFKEVIPLELSSKMGYIKKEVKFTNCIVEKLKDVYTCKEKNIYFL